MVEERCFEEYPFWIVLVSNLVLIATYITGAAIIYRIGVFWVGLYILYLLILELRLIKGHCPDCCYYGKNCAFGKGKISSLFFKKGNFNRFCKMQITWKSILPDFMVSLAPIAIGIFLLIRDFDWILLLLIALLFILGFPGSGFIRSKLACKYCKQRKLGCPAERLFQKR